MAWSLPSPSSLSREVKFRKEPSWFEGERALFGKSVNESYYKSSEVVWRNHIGYTR